MRTRTFARHATALLGGLLLLSLAAPVALAKEGVEVTLAAPISADAAPGDEVEVLFSLTSISDTGEAPLRGSPVFLRLFGPRGDMTEAAGVEGRTAGVYRAMATIPAGGAARAEFGIRGSVTDAAGRTVRSDITWPYTGVLVAAKGPAPVDPNAFQLPGSKPAIVPVAQPPRLTDPAAGAASGSDTTPSNRPALERDPLLVIAAALSIAILVSAAFLVGRGRRRRMDGAPA
jgi:hypothetical protein